MMTALAKNIGRLCRDIGLYLTFPNDGYSCFRGVFSTFDEAKRSAPKTARVGYNHTQVATSYIRESNGASLRSYDYPVLFWLGRILGPSSIVFDVGGNLGTHFYAYGRYLDYPAELSWIVCEVPKISRAGEEIARTHQTSQLSFTTDFSMAETASILLLSGTIQYLGVSSPAALIAPLRRKPRHLLFNRLPLHEKIQFVSLQNGGAAFYPHTVFCKNRFIESLEHIGYEVIDSWEDRVDSCVIPFHPTKSLSIYHGLYLRTRDDSNLGKVKTE